MIFHWRIVSWRIFRIMAREIPVSATHAITIIEIASSRIARCVTIPVSKHRRQATLRASIADNSGVLACVYKADYYHDEKEKEKALEHRRRIHDGSFPLSPLR